MDLHEFLTRFTTGYDSVPGEEPWASLVTANSHNNARRSTQALEVLDAMGETDDAVQSCLRVLVRARSFLQLGRAAEALQLLESMPPEADSGLLRARLYLTMGIAHRLMNRPEKALSYLSLAGTAFEDLQMPADRAVCDGEIGSLLLSRGDVGAATNCYLSALDTFEEFGTDVQKTTIRS
ncbi:MAG: hypothetical protein ACKOBV_07890, partial [Candidatus Kapaibacterium sp.]